MSENQVHITPAIERIRQLINELDVIAEKDIKNSGDFELYASIYQASMGIRKTLIQQGYVEVVAKIPDIE